MTTTTFSQKNIMLDNSDFLNVRKLAFALALGPLGLLLLFFILDVTLPHNKLLQVSDRSCLTSEMTVSVANLNTNKCEN
ncbi:hypothetical protein [aff. Roholtiella sp. LEGE 12411]|uniref:hypothetical protein n=1 Tax=aff. Roholtiella sp. LEGE 12411 TaxID=1828822 RepID=UPI001881504D|nr:hypothetical protein [aff. Roholtiella sp. LEGE 12411]MBE9035154.1 hypothetical protein [aff. Roholtiella sp. LEGE 12411]